MRNFLGFGFVLVAVLQGTLAQWWVNLARKQGPKVCGYEYLPDDVAYSRPWTGGKICGKETLVRFSCCNGYDKITGEPGCPLVKPLTNLADTAKEAGAKEFILHAEKSGFLPMLAERGSFTLFAPNDRGFKSLPSDNQRAPLANSTDQPRDRPPIFLYTLSESRRYYESLEDKAEIPTLYREASLYVTRFPTGLVTVNCVPLVATDIEATNGVVHITDSVLLPPQYPTVTDFLVRQPLLSTLATALVRAQLTAELRAKGPLTVFAPVDQAWEAIPQPFMEALMEDVGTLKALLLYHVVEGVWCKSATAKDSNLKTLEGSVIKMTCNETDVFLNDARIVEGDKPTGNGFVHLIDKVLVPEKVRPIADIAKSLGLNHFLQVAASGGLLTTLSLHGAYTVFAPSDEAFEELSNDTWNNLNSEPTLSRGIIGLHMIVGRHLTPSLMDGQTLSTLRGQQSVLRIKFHRKQTMTVETAVVTSPNHEARNGVLHVINQVIIPAAETVGELLQEEGNYSTFVSLLNHTEPNLLHVLSNRSISSTVFVPDNEAMDQLPPGMLTRLFADPPLLNRVTKQHVVEDFVVTSGFEPRLLYQYTAHNGRPLTLRREDSGTVTVGKLATIVEPDIVGRNGLIHRISRFLHL